VLSEIDEVHLGDVISDRPWVTFRSSHHSQVALAEQYAGLPTEEAA
jgi:hypothetical protein